MNGEPTPDRILQVGLGFWSSKALLSAVELGVFTELGAGGRTGDELTGALGLPPRAGLDLLDAMVALGFLFRDGDGSAALYRNTPATAAFLDRASPRYIGALLEQASSRLFRVWAGLTDALRARSWPGESVFDAQYADPERVAGFLSAMAAVSNGNFQALATGFDFSPYRTVCDVGGGSGLLSVVLARHHRHLRCTTLDLPAVEPVARQAVARSDVADRVTVMSADFFTTPLPAADVVTMSLILHDWNLDRKRQLIRAAYAALPPGGAYIVIENMIDDGRRVNAYGLLSSLNMLVETGQGFDFTAAELRGWCEEAGFTRVETMPLAGMATAAIAYKP